MAVDKTTITETDTGYWIEHEFFYGHEFIRKVRYVEKTPAVSACVRELMKFFKGEEN